MFTMTDQKPATSTSNANLWVIVPFVLAVIGTVVMLFTNSANALKVSLIFALWAAAAGIMLLDRTRQDRDRAVESARRSEAELDDARRELSHRPTTTGTAAPQPAAPAQLSDADMEVIRELQDEIKALREQLEEMRGEAFAYEPAAVRASARRIQEIEQPQPKPEPKVEPKPEPKVESKPASRPGPSSDDTIKLAPVPSAPEPKPEPAPDPAPKPAGSSVVGGRPTGAPSADAVAGRLGSQPTREHPNPLSALISEREAEKAKAQAQAKAQTQAQAHTQAQAGHHEHAHEREHEREHEHHQHEAERHGGRRRRDERGESGLTVAELLARQKQGE